MEALASSLSGDVSKLLLEFHADTKTICDDKTLLLISIFPVNNRIPAFAGMTCVASEKKAARRTTRN